MKARTLRIVAAMLTALLVFSLAAGCRSKGITINVHKCSQEEPEKEEGRK